MRLVDGGRSGWLYGGRSLTCRAMPPRLMLRRSLVSTVKLSMMTWSPGPGWERFLHRQGRRPHHGPSRSIGAVRPSRRRPAVKVVVFNSPCGTAARQRWPRFERPRRRAILVEAPVSSMNTSRRGSRSGWLSSQASRARLRRQRRSCWRRARFFLKLIPWRSKNRHTVPVPTDRIALFQQRLQLGTSRDVRRLLHLGQQERGRALDPFPTAGHRLSDRARCGPSGATHQPNGWRSTRSRRFRAAAPRSRDDTRLDCLNHPDAQILGKIVRHPYWPPSPASIRITPNGNPLNRFLSSPPL